MERSKYITLKHGTKILQYFFRPVLFSTFSEGIHLTFDDGPHPKATLNVLNILRSRKIKATFFVVGENARKYPELVRQIKSEGHQIGNHSFTHSNLILKKKETIKHEILETKDILESTIGVHSSYFRPPYGFFKPAILRILNDFKMTCVLWNVNSKDFKFNSQANKIINRVSKQTVKGSVMLFHDNSDTSQGLDTYLPVIIDVLLDKGFIFNILP